MCGITGWLDWHRDVAAAAATVRAMTETMACRGPDGDGVWLSPRLAMGHRRLAVIDIEGGAQPMAAEHDGAAAVLSFSGEIYNFRELRTELTGYGHAFRTRSDTEVLLRAYLQWGEEAVSRLTGMFAFAVWDRRTETLLLARDRLGIKPLYYHEYDGGLLFGSEPKALLANDIFVPEVDPDGLVDVFSVAAKRPGDAVFRGLREVRPGWTVRVDRSGTHHRRYWRLESRPHPDSPQQTIETIRGLLEETVAGQLVSDVPLGALLSGGLDSSVLCALAAGQLDGKLSTYSVDFAGAETDFKADALHVSRDAPYVAAVVEHLATDHTEVILDAPSLLGELETTLAARDIPGVGDLDVSLYLLFREVRRHTTVALSGEGADDIFGGYPWFAAEAARDSGNFPWSAGITNRGAMLSADLRARLDLDAAIADRYAEAVAEVPRLPGEEGVDRRMREVFHLQITRFLPFLLDRKDRMSMRLGLEVRVPFCDHRLVEYLWNVPWSLKRLGDQEKGVLREATADLLPEKVVRRPKSGFPFGQSPAYLKAIREAVGDLLADPSSPARPLLDAEALRPLLDGDQWSTGTYSPPPWLPRALLLDAWLRRYKVRVR
ncbi:asparagine synthase (glutamine-hydrolyzing) [Phytohabitans kaempferiae]|uniref:asparagine synthase (glutamine-hydrolyzing) n=1 Tax=Phytohabitans kaempferiae TaxID=1620943 RepID=A0ABV6MAR5_9ACTN